MATVLITGASGLIGRHVVSNLGSDLTPVVARRSEHDLLVPGSGRRLVATTKPDIVLHLAWDASGTTDYRTSATNAEWVGASLELAAACLDRGAWFLGTGTAVDTEEPTDAYTAGKSRLWHALAPLAHARSVTWLRPYYVFDEASGRPALVQQALSARARGEELMLRTPGDLHDFVHVSDVARGIVLAMRSDARGVRSIGSGILRSVAQVVEALDVGWQPVPCQGTATQQHQPADIRWLTARGWAPTATEEFFGHDSSGHR